MESPVKMKVEIWSDVMCPFCYIGKRKFEQALAQFENSDQVEVEWKSFQLSPDMKTDTSANINAYLAKHKGISLVEAQRMNAQVTDLASKVGLQFNFAQSILANSFNAHRFAHFAKQKGKQNEAEELLFESYFSNGKNIDDIPTLIALGTEIGLFAEELSDALLNGHFANAVKADIQEAQDLGVRGVPFFVFDRKYAASGAQDSQIFLQTLEKSFEEWRTEKPETVK